MEQLIFPNIPRLYTGIAEALSWLVLAYLYQNKKAHFNLRFPILAVIQVLLQLMVGYWPLWAWFLGICLNIFWMFFSLYLTEKASIHSLIYQTNKSFVFAELMAAFTWQINCYLRLSALWSFGFISFCYLLFTLGFIKINQTKAAKYAFLTVTNKNALNLTLIASMIFLVSNLGFLGTHTPLQFGGSPAIFTMRTFVDLCGLLLIELYENQHYDHYLQHDLTLMNNMVQSQYDQYLAYQESVALVNQRFHDLKHQLATIELEEDSTKRKAYIEKIRADISQFKADVHTDNPILDVILTRKNAYCIAHQIDFTCIADGKLLNKIDTMDLCSLVGNALDNAIESAEKISDTKKRLIKLRLTQKAGFIVFTVDNYTEAQIELTAEKLPKTTKKDALSHGYGLKSIQRIAAKYAGTMTIKNNNHWFSLRILLPQ